MLQLFLMVMIMRSIILFSFVFGCCLLQQVVSDLCTQGSCTTIKKWSENILCRLQGGSGGTTAAPEARSNGYLVWALTPFENEKPLVKTARSNAAKYFLQVEDYIHLNLPLLYPHKRIEALKKVEYGMDYYGRQINKAAGTTIWRTSPQKCGIDTDSGVCGDTNPGTTCTIT